MPCDAVATVQTTLNQDVFNDALTPDILEKVLKPLLFSKTGERLLKSQKFMNNGLSLETTSYNITIRGSIIDINAKGYNKTSGDINRFKVQLSQLLKEISIGAVQIKIRNTIAEKVGQVTNETFNNGAMVLDIEV